MHLGWHTCRSKSVGGPQGWLRATCCAESPPNHIPKGRLQLPDLSSNTQTPSLLLASIQLGGLTAQLVHGTGMEQTAGGHAARHGHMEDAEALRDLPYVLDKVNAKGDMFENVSRPEISRTSRPAA